MNDPWDVKSVRRPHQYQSFMKINGVPLLPPVLSKECRKEMQYYKLLAKEVEKRITSLKPYVDMETVDEGPGVQELTDSEDNISGNDSSSLVQTYCNPATLGDNVYNTINSNFTIQTTNPLDQPTNMMIDLNVNINNRYVESNSPKRCKAPVELPERDYNCPKNLDKNFINEFEPVNNGLSKQNEALKELTKLSHSLKKDESEKKSWLKKGDGQMALKRGEPEKNQGLKKSYPEKIQALRKIEPDKNVMSRKGEADKNQLRKGDAITKNVLRKEQLAKSPVSGEPNLKQTLRNKDSEIIHSQTNEEFNLHQLANIDNKNTEEEFLHSLSSRSYTGSLQDISADCSKDTSSTLTRQRSYTVLKPSPMLMQHLQLQVENTGVEMKLISMSESLYNIPQLQNKKRRRSWDLETAKSQWSSMALELKKNTRPGVNLKSNSKTPAKQINPPSPYLPQSADRCKKPIPRFTKVPKSDPVQKPKVTPTQIRKETQSANVLHANKIENGESPKTPTKIKKSPKVSEGPISTADDPATKVRELYEKIQKQQLVQMASLVEKQKKEQLLLQQVFEEQNNMLFKQLKTICPEPTIDIKQAWCEKDQVGDRGPVSLSQLINQSPNQSAPQSPAANILNSSSVSPTLTSPYRADRLKRSQASNVKHYCQRPKTGLATGNHLSNCTPNGRNASRKLNYDNSGFSNEPLTDRTNDTLADLNVTFPTDNSDEAPSNKTSPRRNSISPGNALRKKATDSAIKSLEDSIQKTMNAVTALTKQSMFITPTAQEREAATKIVAYAKGYLVRRLMRTERVQATVATIRDALLCALELHQDREGIRGADVDLHRRLIQQITAACYNLHDTFITSSPMERCNMIAADRARRRIADSRPPSTRTSRRMDTCPTPNVTRTISPRTSATSMAQSIYGNYESDKLRMLSRRHNTSPTRRPWRN